MMSLPFFAAAIAIALGWRGQRAAAAWLTVLAALATLALFSLHATNSLEIEL